MQYLADSEETLPNIVFWLLGSFATASWHKVLLMSLPLAVAAGRCGSCAGVSTCWPGGTRCPQSWRSGGRAASRRAGLLRGAGGSPWRSAAASPDGSGGPAPRPSAGRADHRRLLPTAFWLGAALMLVVDDLARTLTRRRSRSGSSRPARGAAVYLLLVQSRRRSTT